MSTVLITGTHGFIGKHLARWLNGRGHRVCGLGHGIWPENEAASWGVKRWINGDIQPGNLRLLQHSFGTPEVVFHLAGGSSVGAAIANPREDFVRTVDTTVELLEWLRLDAPQARLLAVSSAAVYGAGHDGPIAVDAALRPYSPYGFHKLMMEQLCRSYAASYGINAVVARLFSVYGPGLKKQLLWDFCSRLTTSPSSVELGGLGAELRDWTEVGDVVRAIESLSDYASPEVPTFNVGTGIASSVRDVAESLAKSWGTPLSLSFSGRSRPGDPFSLVAEASALQLTGFEWRIRPAEGFERYVAWYRAQLGATA